MFLEKAKNKSIRRLLFPTTLTFSNELSNATVEVMNVTGQIVVKKENQSGKQINLDLTNQAAGIYFIEVKQAAEVWRGKVVKN